MEYIFCIAINITSIICFTILAIYFGHWWIALFSWLFIHYVKVDRNKKNEDE